MSGSSFLLPGTQVPIQLTDGLTKDQLLTFPAFKTWSETLQRSLETQSDPSHTFHSAPYKLRKIDVQAVDFFGGGRPGFVKLKAEVTNDDEEKLPGSVFLRGGSVAMMLVLQPDDVKEPSDAEKYVILTTQPRVPAGSLAFVELPAGMIDDSGTFSGAAAKEVEEETGLKVKADELVDLTRLALGDGSSSTSAENLQQGVYPSAGGCDEFVPIFLWQKRIPRRQLSEWQGKLTGLRDHGEKISLTLTPVNDLWKTAGRDAKALAAWSLYQGLKNEGRIG